MDELKFRALALDTTLSAKRLNNIFLKAKLK